MTGRHFGFDSGRPFKHKSWAANVSPRFALLYSPTPRERIYRPARLKFAHVELCDPSWGILTYDPPKWY